MHSRCPGHCLHHCPITALTTIPIVALTTAGPTIDVVKRAKAAIKRLIEEFTEKAMRRETPAAGRYSVV